MRLNLTLNEFGNVCLLLFFGTIGYVPILMPNTGGALTAQRQMDQVHDINHVILLAIWGGIFYFLLKARFRLRLDLLSAKVALVYCAVVVLGVVWSTDLQSAITTDTSAIISTIYAIFLISKFPSERLAVILSWVVLLLALGSAFFALILPQYGIDHFANTGAWQGVFGQKNSLGLVMVYGITFALVLKPRSVIQRAWKLGILFFCVAEVGLSQSREAWVACAALFLVHSFLNVYSRFAPKSRGPVMFLGFLGASAVAGIAATNWVSLLNLLGRDATLTGRTELWKAVLQECKNHLWVGYNGRGFWGTANATRVDAILRWPATSSHNGFLECLLQLGVVGLLPLLVLFSLAMSNGIKLLLSSSGFESSRLWIYSLLTITIFNMVQDTTGFFNSISWILLVGSACMLEQTAHTQAAIQDQFRSVRWTELEFARRTV
ncbi:MAG: O-antigen ligase family protein [Terriglobales bacterium]|jgi:O-antigen ligase